MTYDVMKLCKDEDGKYVVDPAVMVPATVEHIKAVVAGKEELTEIVTPGWTGRPDREPVADRFLREAERIPPAGWDLALEPYTVLAPLSENATQKEKAGHSEAKAKAEMRSRVLGFVESWWKRALALASKQADPGRGVSVYISKNLDYRR